MLHCLVCYVLFWATIKSATLPQVNVLAREYCDSIKRKNKPVILSHPMLMGLKEGQAKMSKSDPDSAIWMEDEAADVKVISCTRRRCPHLSQLTFHTHAG